MHILQLADLGPKWKEKIFSNSVNYQNLQATSCFAVRKQGFFLPSIRNWDSKRSLSYKIVY